MHKKVRSPWMLAAIVCLVTTTQANAQGVQPQIRDLQRNINIDLTNGSLTQPQATDLFNRINQIQAENSRYMNLNGGNLTPMQNARLQSELSGLMGYRHFDASHGAMWDHRRSAQWNERHDHPNWAPGNVPVVVPDHHGEQWHDHHEHAALNNPVVQQQIQRAEHHDPALKQQIQNAEHHEHDHHDHPDHH